MLNTLKYTMAARLPDGSDLTLVRKGGMFTVTDPVGLPAGDYYIECIHGFNHSPERMNVKQTAREAAGNASYVRHCLGGIWGDWVSTSYVAPPPTPPAEHYMSGYMHALTTVNYTRTSHLTSASGVHEALTEAEAPGIKAVAIKNSSGALGQQCNTSQRVLSLTGGPGYAARAMLGRENVTNMSMFVGAYPSATVNTLDANGTNHTNLAHVGIVHAPGTDTVWQAVCGDGTEFTRTPLLSSSGVGLTPVAGEYYEFGISKNQGADAYALSVTSPTGVVYSAILSTNLPDDNKAMGLYCTASISVVAATQLRMLFSEMTWDYPTISAVRAYQQSLV